MIASITHFAKRQYLLTTLVVFVLTGCSQPGAPERLDMYPNGIWHTNDPSSTLSVDHSIWDAFVAKYVLSHESGVNRVDYGNVSVGDRARLNDYITYLRFIPISRYNRDEQIAYWMNLYNAGIVALVLEHFPVDSILQIRGPGINVVGPWLQTVTWVEGNPLSFNDIEHNILRPVFSDMGPPIHYGINCASITCPSLVPRAHTAANWRKNLEDNARLYLRSGQAARLENGELVVSKIYHSWFKEDFGGDDASVIEHLVEFSQPELAGELVKHKRIAGDFYDWRLNKTVSPDDVAQRNRR